MNWDVDVESGGYDDYRACYTVVIKVHLTSELIASLRGGDAKRQQHSLVEWIALRLHRFVDNAFHSVAVKPFPRWASPSAMLPPKR
jgi:hypothetical protein